jgi:UDP-glucose 4-epimerase
MRIVITGASGFLGGFVTRRFAQQQGAEVISVSRRAVPGGTRVSDYSESPDGDVLIHLAQGADRAKVNAEGDALKNGALATLSTLLERGYRRVLLASSGVLYGDADERPHTPRDPIQATDTYTRLKQASERLVLDRHGVAVRLANVYGPGMHATSVLGNVLSQIPGNGPLRVLATRPIRDFLWVEDAAEGFVAIASSEAGSAGGICNLGTGVGTSIGELARAALRIAGEEQRDVVATAERSTRSTIRLDYSETQQLYGWRPGTALSEGLTRLMAHPPRNV